MSAGEDRMGAVIRSQIPYVGSCGALDMVNFQAMDTVPQKFKDRNLYPTQSPGHADAHHSGRKPGIRTFHCR